MKVLILTCNTGSGQNSAAAAIKEYFENRSVVCNIVNALDFLPKPTADLISKGHEFAYKYAPRLYGARYRINEKIPQTIAYEQNSKGVDKLCQTLFSGNYDAVVCVHIFAGMMMTELRVNREVLIPTYFVATDYTCSPGVSEIDADAYFIPHEKLRDEFVEQGVPAEKIVVSGIPVRSEFCKKTDRESARNELGLPQNGRVLLLCCGSMGGGPIRGIALRLGEVLGADDRLVIICGSNKQLARELEFLTSADSRIIICGYTDKMSLYMDASDLVMTKAGGLSTTEAIMKRLPILLIDAVPGCESRNIEFMTANAFALQADTAVGMVELVKSCLDGETEMDDMVRRREEDFPFDAAKTIFETVKDFDGLFAEARKKKDAPEEPPKPKLPSLTKSMMLIINPVAGKRMMARNLAEVIGIFMGAGYTVTVFTTFGRGDATAFVKGYGAAYDMICCSGGDGTLNEVAKGLIEADLDKPVGYMPSGSTNDFAEFHGLSVDVIEAAKAIVSGSERRVDVGKVGSRYFINAADFGAFTWLPYTTPQQLKNKLGFYAYVLDGIKDLAKLQSERLRITMNGETIEDDFIFGIVASSSKLAGTLEYFGQAAVADDGLFETLLIRLPKSPVELQSAIAALQSQNLNNELITFCRTPRVEVECAGKLDWALDGEQCRCGTQHSVEILPRRLRLVF